MAYSGPGPSSPPAASVCTCPPARPPRRGSAAEPGSSSPVARLCQGSALAAPPVSPAASTPRGSLRADPNPGSASPGGSRRQASTCRSPVGPRRSSTASGGVQTRAGRSPQRGSAGSVCGSEPAAGASPAARGCSGTTATPCRRARAGQLGGRRRGRALRRPPHASLHMTAAPGCAGATRAAMRPYKPCEGPHLQVRRPHAQRLARRRLARDRAAQAQRPGDAPRQADRAHGGRQARPPRKLGVPRVPCARARTAR